MSATPHDLTTQDGRVSHVRATAIFFNEHGIDWLVYPRRTKEPGRKRWQEESTPPLSAATDDHNIGMQLRRGAVDGDLDTIEAVRAAPFFLPPTGLIWGREGKPRSHWMYQLAEGEFIPHGEKTSYTDPTPPPGMKDKLLELRVSGQTVAPGSAHEGTGEIIKFEADGRGERAVVTAKEMTTAFRHTAAVALLARYWRDGSRHDMSLPVSGLFFHGKMPFERATLLMQAICAAAQDEEVNKRLDTLADTYRNGNAGGHVTGGPTLTVEEMLTPAQVRKLRKWLDLTTQKQSGILGPDGYPLAGDGDGERFSSMWAGQALYVAVEDAWYIYDGIRWKRDDVKEIRERAKMVVTEFRRVLGERSTLCGQDGIASYKECADYSKLMGNTGAITAMLLSAQSKLELRAVPEEFDAHPLMLNVKNCTLDFDTDTGRVTSHEHNPADKLTMLAPINYYPGSSHPLLALYRERFFPEEERWLFLWEMAGYSMTGLPKRHTLQLIGPSHAGKSLTLSLVSNTLGQDYAGALRYGSLMKDPHGTGGDAPRNDLWAVRKARLVAISEIPREARFDTALLKAMHGGGDKTRLRDLHRGGAEIKWVLSIWMSGNEPYGPPPNEDAAFERLEVLPCEHVYPGNKRKASQETQMVDPEIVGDAVLALMVEGFTRLYGAKGGVLAGPESTRIAKTKLRNDLDPYSEAIERLFEFTGDPDDGVPKTEAWAYVRSEREMYRNSYKEQAKFEESLQRRGAILAHNAARFKGDRYWQGVQWSAVARATYSVTLPDWTNEGG